MKDKLYWIGLLITIIGYLLYRVGMPVIPAIIIIVGYGLITCSYVTKR